MQARDGERDVLSCGPGADIAVVDAKDRVSRDCETVNSPTTPAPRVPKPGLTREGAVVIGTPVDLTGSWRVTVVSVTPDATAAVMAANQFNDPPAAGRQFFIARVSATYIGAGSARLSASYRLRAVGPAAVSYSTFNDSCGVIPDELGDPDVFTSGTLTGNVCWSVAAGDAPALVMFDEPLSSNATRYFFRLF